MIKRAQKLIGRASSVLGRESGRSMRYLMAAGLNTVFGLAIFPILLWSSSYLRHHYLIGLAIAQAVSLCFAFITYKFGVFRTRGGYAREFTAFASFYLVNYAANWAALPALVELAGWSPIIAQLFFSLLVIVGSYLWHSRVTFRKSSDFTA
jgi:putative flippase GtrA